MNVDIVTKEDLNQFRIQVLKDFKTLLEEFHQIPQKRLLKSFEVMIMLSISKNTLKTYRTNGTLSSKKVGGVYYYLADDIHKLLQQ